MVWWLAVSAGVLLLLGGWWFVRTVHIGRLAIAATTARESSDGSRNAPTKEDLRRSRPSIGSSTAEAIGATAFAVPAEAIWEIGRIDHSVISAISAASSHAGGIPAVDATYSGFLDYVAQHGGSLGNAGFASRLIGYVGEQQAADALANQGHVITMALSPTNPGWDLLVDGHAANVKTYQDAANMAHFANHDPGTSFLVPHDAANIPDLPNVHPVAGFSYTDAHRAFSSSVDAGHSLVSGDFVGDAMSHGVPVTLIAFSAYRQIRAVRNGKNLGSATRDFAIDTTARATGVIAGAKSGAILGAVGGPHGAVIGGLVGGILGSIGGAQVSGWIQDKPIRDAEARLKEALADYGAQFTTPNNSEKLTSIIWSQAVRSQQAADALEDAIGRDRTSLRWRTWPGADQVLRRTSLAHGLTVLEAQVSEAEAEIEFWSEVLSDPDGPVYFGLAMANAPHAAAQFDDIKGGRLACVSAARSQLENARTNRRHS